MTSPSACLGPFHHTGVSKKTREPCSTSRSRSCDPTGHRTQTSSTSAAQSPQLSAEHLSGAMPAPHELPTLSPQFGSVPESCATHGRAIGKPLATQCEMPLSVLPHQGGQASRGIPPCPLALPCPRANWSNQLASAGSQHGQSGLMQPRACKQHWIQPHFRMAEEILDPSGQKSYDASLTTCTMAL